MRRLFWYGTILTVITAVNVYLASLYVASNPDASFSRGIVFLYRMGTDYNPMYWVSQKMAEHTSRALREVVAQLSSQADAPALALRNHKPAEVPEPAVEPENNDTLPPELLTLIQTQGIVTEEQERTNGLENGHGYTNVALDAGQPAGTQSIFPRGSTVTVDPGTGQDPDDCPKIMPPCNDDEGEAPAVMPYVEDQDTASADKDCADYLKRTVNELRDRGKEIRDSDAGQEESEAGDEQEPPLEEDPAYHHQYPGCPHSGYCPYSGRGPADDYEPVPPPKSEKKSADDAEESEPAQPTIQEKQHSKEDKNQAKHPNGGGKCGSEECPAHPEVDTMEFRPSDAHEGEFDPKPM